MPRVKGNPSRPLHTMHSQRMVNFRDQKEVDHDISYSTYLYRIVLTEKQLASAQYNDASRSYVSKAKSTFGRKKRPFRSNRTRSFTVRRDLRLARPVGVFWTIRVECVIWPWTAALSFGLRSCCGKQVLPSFDRVAARFDRAYTILR